MKYAFFNGNLAATFAAFAITVAVPAQAQDKDTVEADNPDELDVISLDIGSTEAVSEYDETFADDEDTSLIPQPTDQESNLDELHRSFSLYKSALATGSFGEADTLAKRMVELAIRLYGLDSHESATALANLGLVQHKTEDYESAVLNFIAAVEIVERIEDRLHGELINPLRGLGAAQLGSGRPELARAAFDRAVHISHVNEGPHNLMQVDILEDLAETYLSIGDPDKALDIHQFIYNLEARNVDLKSEEIIPALTRQAEWMHRMRILERERMTWRRIINILEHTRGKKDLGLIPPLTGLGRSYLYVPNFQLDDTAEVSMASGDAYLKRAVRITENNPESSWADQQQTLLELGDYYTLTGRPNKANRIYKETWVLLSDEDDRLAIRASLLEKPLTLQVIHPPKYYNSDREDSGEDPPDSFQTGAILVGFTISERGATRNVEIIDADPPGLEEMEYSVMREMRRMLHRPRMQDGDTVDTNNRTYTHEFFYRPSDIPGMQNPGNNINVSTEPSVTGATTQDDAATESEDPPEEP